MGHEHERAGGPRRYSFRLYPTRGQEAELRRQCRMVGELWNALLERQESLYRHVSGQRGVVHLGQGRFARGRWRPAAAGHLTFYDMTAEITRLRRECPEWEALSVWTAHRVCRALTQAFAAFFARARRGSGRRSGYPRYRPRRRQTWLPHRFASGCRLTPYRGTLWSLEIKGLPGSIKARGALPAPPRAWTDADIRERADGWWLSVCVEMPARRVGGAAERTIEMNLLDSFARVDGCDVPAWAIGAGLDSPGLTTEIEALQRLRSAHPRGSDEWRRTGRRIARLHGKAARRRREALHEWTTEVVRGARALTVVRPGDLPRLTASGRGDAHHHGAAVRLKAEMNRHVLAQAPAQAAAMLAYKAAEAGIDYREIAAAIPPIAVGALAVRNRKAIRRIRRTAERHAA